MATDYLALLRTFDINSLPDLDMAVLGALQLFEKEGAMPLSIDQFSKPLVVGSGNAEATGRIIFENKAALFASESTYEEKLRNIPDIDGVVVVSASGAKHAPIIVSGAKKKGKPVVLITNTKDAPASEYADDVFVYPKNREPYTYNTSTYMGMILGHTGEDPAAIRRFITDVVGKLPFPDFSRYDKYYLIVPPRFAGIIRMLQVKFIELFGRRVARDVETAEYVKHATTVVPSDELFLSFGEENTVWGAPENRFHVPLPEGGGYAAMMAVSYYTIGQIQKAHPPYFKEHIAEYVKKASEAFGSEIHAIVE